MQNKDFSSYNSEDFASNESFLNYCFNNNTEDVEFWNNWLKTHPQKAGEIANARKMVDALALKLPEEEYNQELRKIKAAIKDQELAVPNIGKAVPKSTPMPTSSRLAPYLRVAASLLVLLISGFLITRYLNQSAISPITYIEKANPPGQKSAIFLKDGSKVILNSASKISYSEDFGTNHRMLSLEGEAFFEVARDTILPFIVTSGDISTTALGTSFNIKAYPADSQINVSLVSGKVNVSGNPVNGYQADSIYTTLVPGEQVTYEVQDRQFEKGEFLPREMLGWKDGVIFFRDTAFDEVINTLERWYGVKFEIKGAKGKGSPFSGEFHNENLENVLEAMSYSQKFQYRIDKRNVTLDFIK